jgi:putative endopeptidase
MGAVNATFLGSIFSLDISPDAKDPNRYSVTIGQAGLGLPDRNYYLADQFADKKTAYEAYVADLLRMAGWDRPDEAARAVVAFESGIAEVSWTRTEDRDSEKLYNPMSVADLAQAAPFAWSAFLAAGELKDLDRVVVLENTAVVNIAALYAAAPLDTLKAWQAFHLADSVAPYLSKRFVDLNFSFRQRSLSGVSDIAPRWRRAVDAANTNLGEAIGRVYVARHFPPEAKARIDVLVALCRVAFRHRIERIDWMGAETKAYALNKLEHLRAEIAYPSRWRDYAALRLRTEDLAGNIQSATSFEWRRKVARLNLAVDRSEWSYMTPQTVDAYNDSSLNAIFFPAAILQRPFFDPEADLAVNYGGIASVIGHEMTHSFDDDGRRYDETGSLSNWWTLADAQEFRDRTARLGRQFDPFEPLPGLHVNGDLTMGENIADLGGALIALDAYHLSLQGKPAPVIDGLTGDQRFFLSYAQSWRDKTTEDEARQRLVSNPHSPEIYRVNGVVRNMDAWYAAFDVKPTDKLYLAPENRARIW